ncbi:MAG: hypothetical protein HPY74_16935 [Firmicutes bacterium]|nr:hypothetical protein [Bacillota bacterium]
MSKTVLRFFDDFWLDVRKNIKRNWYSPVLAGRFDRAGIYPSAAWCPEIGKYRLWYEIMPDFANDGRRLLALAESDDGLNWYDADVPVDDLPVEIRNYSSIVLAGGPEGIHGTSVFRDPYEKDPAKLYKACTLGNRVEFQPRSPEERNLVMYFSPDGVNWDSGSSRIVYPFTSDTYNCILYNPIFKKYMVFFRASNVDRRVAKIESNDLLSWSRPTIIIHPDAGYSDESEMIQLYAMWAGWFDGMFLGHLWRFHTEAADESYPKMFGYMDTELVYSYNGINWMHTTRKPLVERPVPPEYGHTQLALSGMFETKEKDAWILVGCASRGIHGTSRENKRLYDMMKGRIININFYRIRRDGLCGLECCGRKGIIGTKPFELLDGDITFNVNAPFGFVRFAITDPSAKPLEGFSFDDCEPYCGDGLDVAPVWKGHSLAELKGRRIRIWIELNTAILYSISATIRPYIWGPQVSISDPTRVEMDEGMV